MVGLVSMVGQVALLRELAVASFGVELVFLAGTACWMAAGAAGALIPPRRAWVAVGLGLVALAVLLPLELAFLRAARGLLGDLPGAYLPPGRQLATAALGLMPTAAALGWLFRSAARAAAEEGGSLAAAYGWESLGGAVGCALSTLAFAVEVSNLALALGGGVLAALAAAALVRGARVPALAVAAGMAALLAASPSLDRRMTGWSHPMLALTRDTPYGRVALVETEGQLTVFENDALVWSSEGTEAEALVHPAALQRPTGARVLVLEGGLQGLVVEALKHAPARVDAVERDAALLRALEPRLPADGRAALASPLVHLVVADPRAFLASGADPYDLILVGAGEPSSGQANRLYTAESFQRCAARLAPGGVLALRLPSLENRWTPGLLARNGAVHAAPRSAFGAVAVLPGQADVFLASQSGLELDPAELAARLRARAVASRELTPESLRWLLTNDRSESAARALANSGAAPNTDERPLCYQQTALLWLGRLVGGAQDARLPGPAAAYATMAALGALALAARLSRRARPWALVAVASFSAMALEGAVILRYQAWSGALFRDLGLLLTAFMLGLAGGGWAMVRAGRHARGRGWGAAALLALALACAAFAASVRAGLAFGLLPASALLVAAGGAMSALFGWAGQRAPAGTDAAGALYAADLVGGCAGSLLAGGLLVLVLGLAGTGVAAAALALVALALVA